LEGDSNTNYFQLIANGKHRKTRIFQLQHEDGVIEGDEALREYATNYYKDLFSAPTGFFLLSMKRGWMTLIK
jgi:hypothetical protein